jgi:hypothetical protein
VFETAIVAEVLALVSEMMILERLPGGATATAIVIVIVIGIVHGIVVPGIELEPELAHVGSC